MFNSFEERALIEGVSGREGSGRRRRRRVRDSRAARSRGDFGKKFDIRRPFAIYVGRIDENKGCRELFDYFGRYAAMNPQRTRPRARRVEGARRFRPTRGSGMLGFLSDEDKFDAIAAADVLIMPSRYESLSMVALEAWALGRPVLANGHCDVLRGQVIRSNGGLYYETFEEFAEALYALEAAARSAARSGRTGASSSAGNYTWPVIERKYLDMFERLQREPAARAARARCRAGSRAAIAIVRPPPTSSTPSRVAR